MITLPKVLRIEPASNCNLSCSHCPTGTIEMERDVMSDQIFYKILNEIDIHKKDIKVIVLYHGGEPLLNKKFFDMVKEIRKISNDFFIKTVSNGMALNKINADKLIKSTINEIEFSLDGLSPTESENIRINSSSKRIINNILYLIDQKSLVNSNLNINIVSTQFLNSNISNINDQIKKLKEPSWLKTIFKKNVKYKTNFAMKWPHMSVSKNYKLKKTIGDDINYCDHVINTLTVRADGSVVPCCYDLTSQLVMGNIKFQSLSEIFNSKNYNSLRKSINDKKYKSICKDCNTVRPPIYLVKSD